LKHTIPALAWKLGLTVLGLAALAAYVASLNKGELAPTGSLPLTWLAAWLIGCALAVWNHRLGRWAIVLLGVGVLASLILLPRAMIPLA
jgi:hypothetical protein